MGKRSSKSRTLRVGIVGCGRIAVSHVRAFEGAKRTRIVAVYDPVKGAATTTARKTGAEAAPSISAMIEQYALDAVSVCSPAAAHLDNCTPFLTAGIPVLCEKPLAQNPTVAARIARKVKTSHTPFMVAFCHRFHPAIIELKRLLDRGVLGRPLLFRNIFAGYYKLAGTFRMDPDVCGGGCLIENCCHSFDLFRYLMGEPSHARAITDSIQQDAPVEDFCMVHLEAKRKVYGEICSSFSLPPDGYTVEVRGNKGRAAVNYFDPSLPELAYYIGNSMRRRTVDVSNKPHRITAQIEHFLDCVRHGRHPSVTVEDGVKAGRIAAACYRSAREGRRIRLP